MNTSFFRDLLQTIAERGRSLIERARARNRRGNAHEHSDGLVELCEELLSGRGEASGVALAREILTRFGELTIGPRIAFFEALAQRFGVDRKRLEAAIETWRKAPSQEAAAEIHAASAPRRHELFGRLNLAPQGTAALVKMRAQLLDVLDRREDLAPVDDDFADQFASWFNRGFLVLRRIDWSTPATVLEKIIRYEAVHEIKSWEDLRARIDPPDRRCYAFFHPALVDEPLIFVEVALTREVPNAIAPILALKRTPLDPERATTALFYSISNCQRGLSGVTFGHFLIKQVAQEVSREYARLTTFVTLSPAPGFATWLARARADAGSSALDEHDRAVLAGLDAAQWRQDAAGVEALRDTVLHAAAWYFLQARNRDGAPLDPVARFHLGNGARLERLNWPADLSGKALAQSHGLMVNYRYDLANIEKNHEAYAESRKVVASSAVMRLARSAARELVPVPAPV